MEIKLYHVLFFILLVYILFKFINKNNNDNIFFYNNFLSDEDFNKINKICKKKKFKNDVRVNSRKTICLFNNENNELYDLIYKNKKLKKIIKNITNKNYKIYPDFPIEFRVYPPGSSGMRWHKDSSLFYPDCLELVLTLENYSESKFQWIDKNNKINYIKPKSNTLVIVKPSTVLHNVTPTGNGYRTILKFVIQFENSIKKPAFYKEIKNCPK